MLAVLFIVIIVFLLLELPSAKQVVFLFSASLVSISSFLPSLSFLQAVILLVLCLIVMTGRPSREAQSPPSLPNGSCWEFAEDAFLVSRVRMDGSTTFVT